MSFWRRNTPTTDQEEAPLLEAIPKAEQLDGIELQLACAQAEAISAVAKAEVREELEKLGVRLGIYSFKERSKRASEILRKVRRLRDSGDASLQGCGPAAIEDAWGCRFVTLFQLEIVEVLEELLDFLGGTKGQAKHLSLVNIVVYSNRPENDPLALHKLVEETISACMLNGEIRKLLGGRRPIVNRESGYSSLHLTVEVPVQVDLGSGDEPKRARFEIQIRDVFEEGWSEISHRLAYKRSSRGKDDIGDHRYQQTLRIARSRELNALKASADACSQHATLIDRNMTYWLDSAGLTGTDLSVSRIDEDLQNIRAVVSGKPEAHKALAEAYQLLHAAHTAAVKELDNRIAEGFYRSAYARFGAAINMLNAQLDTLTAHGNGMPIRYYLLLEHANARVNSVRPGDKSAEAIGILRGAIADYELLRKDQHYEHDATIRLRLGQALYRAAQTEGDYVIASRVFEEARVCAQRDKLLRPGHWLPLQTSFHISNCYFGRAEMFKGNDRLTAMRQAAESANALVGEATSYVTLDSAHINLAHKCLNNAVYFSSQLYRELGGKLEADAHRRLEKQIDILLRPPYKTYVETHTETIDTLMNAADLIGKRELATEMANKNVIKLRQVARARSGRDDPQLVTDALYSDEQQMYESAMRIVHPLDYLRSSSA